MTRFARKLLIMFQMKQKDRHEMKRNTYPSGARCGTGTWDRPRNQLMLFQLEQIQRWRNGTEQQLKSAAGYVKIPRVMKPQLFLLLIAIFALTGAAQSPAARIYETEKAFEKLAADKGVSAAFIEFMAPMGVMFVPEQRNAREFWKSIPPSTSYLT